MPFLPTADAVAWNERFSFSVQRAVARPRYLLAGLGEIPKYRVTLSKMKWVRYKIVARCHESRDVRHSRSKGIVAVDGAVDSEIQDGAAPYIVPITKGTANCKLEELKKLCSVQQLVGSQRL